MHLGEVAAAQVKEGHKWLETRDPGFSEMWASHRQYVQLCCRSLGFEVHDARLHSVCRLDLFEDDDVLWSKKLLSYKPEMPVEDAVRPEAMVKVMKRLSTALGDGTQLSRSRTAPNLSEDRQRPGRAFGCPRGSRVTSATPSRGGGLKAGLR